MEVNEFVRYVVLDYRLVWGVILLLWALFLTASYIGSSPVASFGGQILRGFGLKIIEKREPTTLIPWRDYCFKTFWLFILYGLAFLFLHGEIELFIR